MRSLMLAAFVIDFGVFLACLVISMPLAVLAFAGLLWIGISIPPEVRR